jgi:hypothetical protein
VSPPQALDPLVLNGAIVLMLGSPHPRVAALALDVIRAMHAVVPVVEVTPAGVTAGPGHVMFANLVYQLCHSAHHKQWRAMAGACDALSLVCELVPHRWWLLKFQYTLIQACMAVLVRVGHDCARGGGGGWGGGAVGVAGGRWLGRVGGWVGWGLRNLDPSACLYA